MNTYKPNLYNVGDKVVVRGLQDIIDEFGVEDGVILVPSRFMPDMRSFCETVNTVERVVSRSDGKYSYTFVEDYHNTIHFKWKFDECVLMPYSEIDSNQFEIEFDDLFDAERVSAI